MDQYEFRDCALKQAIWASLTLWCHNQLLEKLSALLCINNKPEKKQISFYSIACSGNIRNHQLNLLF